jgi:signal transduction histidine kinase
VRLEEEFRQAQKMEALARITSAVAHDFNNLLTVIRGNVDLALENADNGVGAELLEIRKAAELGSAVIAQLMTFGGQKRRATVVDVNATLRTLRTILERLLGPAAALSVNADAGRTRVQMDGGALDRVLINLVVNAREAMRATGRVQITTRNVRVAGPAAGHTANPLHDFIEIEVADTGAGMTPEIRDRIFELYFTTKDAMRGTGHGLATVYAIVRDAGGTITVDTEPGRGTTFWIRLPLLKS